MHKLKQNKFRALFSLSLTARNIESQYDYMRLLISVKKIPHKIIENPSVFDFQFVIAKNLGYKIISSRLNTYNQD